MHPHRVRVDDRVGARAHRGGTRRMQRRLCVSRHPVHDLLVGLDRGSRRDLSPIESVERRLGEDAPSGPHGLDPLTTITLGREVVERDGRLLPGVGARDLHRPGRVGEHGPDVHLVAVALGRRRTVVANRDRKEVEHQVRIWLIRIRLHERSGLEVIRRRRPPTEQPLEPDPRRPPFRQMRLHRHRFLAGVLDVHLEVVLQILADTGKVTDHVDAEAPEVIGVPDAGELQELRRVEGTTARDHLGPTRRVARSPLPVLDPDTTGSLEQQSVRGGTGDQREVRAIEHRVQIGTGRTEPAPAHHVLVEGGEPLLTEPVDVVGPAEAGLWPGLEPRLEQRVGSGAAFEREWAIITTPLVGAGQALLHPLEVRQAVAIVPGFHARPFGPLLIVGRIPSLEDHAVDARRPAEHLAPSVIDPPTTHVRLGLALVLPVVEAIADRMGERRRHVDEDVPLPVGPPGFDHQDLVGRIGAQPICQRTTGRATADDDVVVLVARHEPRLRDHPLGCVYSVPVGARSPTVTTSSHTLPRF